MLTVVCLILSFGYNELIFMIFFSRTLKRRYSNKVTLFGTALGWIAICVLKVPFFFYLGIFNLTVLNLIVLAIICIYQIVFFQGTPVKRALSMVCIYVYMFFMEMVSLNLCCLFTGENRIMRVESDYTLTALFLMFVLLILGFYPLLGFWNLLLQFEKNSVGSKLWLCILLPLSQYFFMEYFAQEYEVQYLNIPTWSVIGLFLGILADFYMFLLFDRENRQRRAEQGLFQEQELYRREQLYYEQLKEGQKETDRIRHDLQNYVLALHNMMQKENETHT